MKHDRPINDDDHDDIFLKLSAKRIFVSILLAFILFLIFSCSPEYFGKEDCPDGWDGMAECDFTTLYGAWTDGDVDLVFDSIYIKMVDETGEDVSQWLPGSECDRFEVVSEEPMFIGFTISGDTLYLESGDLEGKFFRRR